MDQIVQLLIAAVIGYIILFFVIKGAIKAAFTELDKDKSKTLNSEFFGVKNIRDK